MGSLPRVQTLSESGIETVPLQYVRPDLEPTKAQNTHIPVIDWHGLSIPHLQQETIAAISTAAKDWGFFQIINHGIPHSLISRVQALGKAFFSLPIEEKETYRNEEAGSHIGYGSKVGYSSDAKLDWGDYYYNVAWPPDRRNMSKWPKQTSDFTEVMDEYGGEVYRLWEVLMEALSRGLGLENKNTLNKAVGGDGKEMHIRINYYPPCPQPDLIVSNGRYKSMEHRSVVNKEKARISWAMFCNPHDEVILSPLPALIDKDHPALYQSSSWKEYLQKFIIKGLDGRGHVRQLQQS